MRVLDDLVGHEPTLEGLWRAAAVERLPHALLFEGPSGVGKFQAALRLANGLLCAAGPGPPCGTCAPCKRVRSGARRGNHPDLYLVDAVEEAREEQKKEGGDVRSLVIKLERIAVREGEEDCAEGFLRLVSAEDGWRIVILREAHRMQGEAQNALLKTLEEPSQRTLLILETAHPGKLLPTIRSRCVRILFDALPVEATQEILEREGLDATTARELARWSGGAPGEALRLEREGARGMRELFAALLRGERDALQTASELWKLPGEYLGSTPRARDRHRARVAMDVLLDVLPRAWEAAEDAPDVRESAATPASSALFSELLEARARLAGNVTPEAAIEQALGLLERARAVGSR